MCHTLWCHTDIGISYTDTCQPNYPYTMYVTYCAGYCGVTLTVSSVALRPVSQLTISNSFYIRFDGSGTHEDTQRSIASISTGSQTKTVFVFRIASIACSSYRATSNRYKTANIRVFSKLKF